MGAPWNFRAKGHRKVSQTSYSAPGDRVHPGALFLHLRRKPVAHAAHRMDVSRGLRVVFQLLAQPGDVHIVRGVAVEYGAAAVAGVGGAPLAVPEAAQ